MHTVRIKNQETNKEPIPGYVLRERIGFGGYGEVWSAEAPGGLEKAIKFVFGQLTEDRAQREMKSLGRIKEVHHPFLLSLERIEVVDGQLLIVTELADGSLKDRFDACLANRLRGIPHKELLRHLRDAADALDYIYEVQSLQHLDVKPENLLLLGGRVKVADFGLLKDLNSVENSLMDGLTPKYAAPELFDGRPSRHSDQYSLAIVYQEMLTGVSPFDGRTCAQLAVQHLHRAPKVDSLPWSDRAIIERALAKSPDDRFPDCRAFVDELLHCARQADPPKSTTTVVTAEMPGSPPDTIILPSVLSDSQFKPSPAVTLQFVKPKRAKETPDKQRPSLIIGLGGCGSEVLNQLQQHLDSRFGPHAEVPSLAKMYLDTDSDSLHKAADNETVAGRANSQFFLTRLRTGKEYSAEYQDRFSSIDRRWIYNVPRSRQTEGIRALGRLAMLDHYDSLVDRIHEMVRKLISPDSLALSTTNAGIEFSDAPQVIVVAAAGGGAGGGMLIDFAYLVRRVMHDLQIPDFQLGAVTFLGSSKQRPFDLSAAASHALVTELNYFGNYLYPGDKGLGIAGFDYVQKPYDYFYMQEWGEELLGSDFQDRSKSLAGYIEQRVIGPASSVIGNQEDDGPPSMRTLGTVNLGKQHDQAEFIQLVSQKLIQDWLGPDINATASDESAASALWQEKTRAICKEWTGAHLPPMADLVQLTTDELANRVKLPIEDYTKQCLANELKILVSAPPTEVPERVEEFQHRLTARESESELPALHPVVREIQLAFSKIVIVFLDQWTNELADTANLRIGAVRLALQLLRTHLESLSNSLQGNTREISEEIDLSRAQLIELLVLVKTDESIAKDEQLAQDHIVWLSRKIIERTIAKLVSVEITRTIRLVQNHMELVVQRSRMWQANLAMALKMIKEQATDNSEDGEIQVLPDLSDLDQTISQSPQWKLSQVLDDGRFDTNDFVDSVQVLAARHLVCGDSSAQTTEELDELIEAGLPEMATELGGNAELVWVVPPGTDPEAAKQKLAQASQMSTTVVAESNSPTSLLIWEVSNVPIADVATRLLNNNPDREKMSRRLATRVDLDF